MGLGAIAISPLEEASAYATLAAGGIYSKPMAIRKVVLANGKVDTDAGWGQPKRQRVISDGVAYEVTQILEDNVLEGTGVGAYFGRPAAGKTGTTDNHADAWFSGYMPQLETTVWVGYPQGEIPMENVHGISVAGGTFPATIWKLFMEAAIGERARARLATARCDPVVWRPFTQGQYGVEPARRPRTYYYSPPPPPATTTGGNAAPTPPPPATTTDDATAPPAAAGEPTAPPPPPPPSGAAASRRPSPSTSGAAASAAQRAVACGSALRAAVVAIPVYLAACAVPDGGLFRGGAVPRPAHLPGLRREAAGRRRCPTATCSSSTRRARSRCSCRRPRSARTTTTRPSRR